MNKVNLCWVMSEGRKGHEIQSMTLAQQLAHNCCIHHFTLSQPWESFAPKIIPGLQYGIKWQTAKPDFQQPPNLIISTGRKSATVAKFITQKLRNESILLKHIQILNPKDNASNYDVLLIPEHDQKKASNIVTYTGSLHPFSPQWFNHAVQPKTEQNTSTVLMIGNPPNQYFRSEFKTELRHIRALYPTHPLAFCGSPRLSVRNVKAIKLQMNPSDLGWFSLEDGPNPYHQYLKHAKHLFVTADSINMMNECAASNSAVSILAQRFIHNPKHLRYIQSLTHRWHDMSDNILQPIKPIPYALDQVLNGVEFQKLLKLPSPSKGG